MSDDVDGPVSISGRVKLGVAVFVVSILLPLAGLPLVASSGLSAGVTATASGVLLVMAEVLGLAAVAIMGKPGYRVVKDRVLRFLGKHGPPDRVGRTRHRIGLLMFTLPLLFGWLYPYVAQLVEGVPRAPLAVAVLGDVILLVSLFVLGGDFWDKIRSLFVREATASFSQGSTPAT